jgi:hypothetical protein
MSRETWPLTLAALLAEPVVRHCPEACPFTELCSTNRQVGIADLFRRGDYRVPTDCLWYERGRDLVHRELGIEPPASAAALRVAMGQLRQGVAPNTGDAWEQETPEGTP